MTNHFFCFRTNYSKPWRFKSSYVFRFTTFPCESSYSSSVSGCHLSLCFCTFNFSHTTNTTKKKITKPSLSITTNTYRQEHLQFASRWQNALYWESPDNAYHAHASILQNVAGTPWGLYRRSCRKSRSCNWCSNRVVCITSRGLAVKLFVIKKKCENMIFIPFHPNPRANFLGCMARRQHRLPPPLLHFLHSRCRLFRRRFWPVCVARFLLLLLFVVRLFLPILNKTLTVDKCSWKV